MAEHNQKRYKITCPHCGKIQYACKSILHIWGMYDLGHGICLGCNKLVRLIYNPETDEMRAEKWGD